MNPIQLSNWLLETDSEADNIPDDIVGWLTARPASIAQAISMTVCSLKRGNVYPTEILFNRSGWLSCCYRPLAGHRLFGRRGYVHPQNLFVPREVSFNKGNERLIDFAWSDAQVIDAFRRAAEQTGFGREIEIMRYSRNAPALVLITQFRLSDGQPTRGTPEDPRWNGELSQVALKI